MINFSDEWMVQTLAADRLRTLHDEARKHNELREFGAYDQPTLRIRRVVGLKMMELGQSVLRANTSAADAKPLA